MMHRPIIVKPMGKILLLKKGFRSIMPAALSGDIPAIHRGQKSIVYDWPRREWTD
jgi:hypothetical protein